MIAVDFPPDPALPLPLQQSGAYAAALRAMGHPVWQARVGRAHALVSKAAGFDVTIRGPVFCPATDEDARAGALRALGLRLVEAENDVTPLRRAGFVRVVTPATVAEWDLAGTAAARRTGLHGKWRNALRRGEAAGLRIEEGPFRPAPAHWIYQGCRALARERRFRLMPLTFTDAFVAATPGAARLWAAYEGKRPVAGMVFLRHGPVATYHLGWTSEAGRAANAHHVLLTRAADWLAGHGTLRLDLGTLDTDAAPGLARFKLGTGAAARALGGSWVRLPGLAPALERAGAWRRTRKGAQVAAHPAVADTACSGTACPGNMGPCTMRLGTMGPGTIGPGTMRPGPATAAALPAPDRATLLASPRAGR